MATEIPIHQQVPVQQQPELQAQMIQQDDQISFQYANECDLEIHCSPFGLSGLYIKINGTNIMGIGSAMGLITGSTKGLIHYNDSNDFIDQKYKLYVTVDDDGILRIDFTKIFKYKNEVVEKKSGVRGTNSSEDTSPNTFTTASLGSEASTNPNSTLPNSIKEDDVISADKYNEGEVPTLIFRGKCPEGRPDKTEPFIGIFSFETED